MVMFIRRHMKAVVGNYSRCRGLIIKSRFKRQIRLVIIDLRENILRINSTTIAR